MRERIGALAAQLIVVAVAACATGTVAESPVASVAPTESPAPTTTPIAASTAPSNLGGHQVFIAVFKVWDADGNLTTTDDRETFQFLDFPAGEYPLEFELDLEVPQGDAPDFDTLPLDGTEQTVFMIEYEGESLTATVTEIRKDDSSLVGGHCSNVETNEIVSGLEGDAVTFDIPGSGSFSCTFFNTPIPDLNVEGN